LKEYIAIILVVFFLIILSETKIKLGMDKFEQLSCAAHLKAIYDSMQTTLEDTPGAFAESPEKPWYTILKINSDYLKCPDVSRKNSTSDNDDKNMPACDYAINSEVYDDLKQGRNIFETYQKRVFILDSEKDPANFNIFPIVNPDFRHSDGCNILLIDGTVIWSEKTDFTGS